MNYDSAELGWKVWDSERDIIEKLFSESVMRRLLDGKGVCPVFLN